jgi:hypothetical protein
MKKAILSTLCSAFVIPGLGQIINQDLKKGVSILAATFILFIAALINLYRIISGAMKMRYRATHDSGSIIERLGPEDFSALWILLGLFAVIWLYSIVDAFLKGRKIDKINKEVQP